jgi:hypothetical protein
MRWEDEIEKDGDRDKARVYVLFADAGTALMVSFFQDI